MLREKAEIFIERLEKAGKAVVLTGAGVSTSSGIPDFRSKNGLYSKISEDTFDLDNFLAKPLEYYKTALEYIHPLADAEPNAAHKMLAELESRGLIEAVITQNIDNLHQKAGSKNVVEFHGNIKSFFCTGCAKQYTRNEVEEFLLEGKLPECRECGRMIRPGVVFFGDPIPEKALTYSYRLASECGAFAAIGSSLCVMPASNLPLIAMQGGADVFVINREQVYPDNMTEYNFTVDISEFSEAVLEVLGQSS
ncbi:NAD-dependent protein deacetylase [Sedimentisphaera cyanobacteriorum]|uniref:protein acetyllysine N-acetyltransferase n=1 Tax=Sedimentisphaera cyanobacteriorum TaxID=1940790 RepID=A0A1Q2HSA8_9BACT|nr:Sir2 family NAD-dependent protein deacetylase [Sedimentisphaera cyanobacteriorum]AQQ10322.1 NAD-dependent protein deacetylase [Sedimentisphaera cyanobacteriorum]